MTHARGSIGYGAAAEVARTRLLSPAAHAQSSGRSLKFVPGAAPLAEAAQPIPATS